LIKKEENDIAEKIGRPKPCSMASWKLVIKPAT
jgi:hypothetical protein